MPPLPPVPPVPPVPPEPPQPPVPPAHPSPPTPTWPPHLDAVVAAPRHHRVLLENERVRVLDTTIEPGETVPLHTHRWPASYYILSIGDFVRRDAAGTVLHDSRAPAGAHPNAPSTALRAGDAAFTGPMPPHTLENVGATSIRVIVTELKDGPSVTSLA